nr:MAG TPA: hypothetical protein [Caudoviricetes sp.]
MPIKLGVPLVPSHIDHPFGISEEEPPNIIIAPLGINLFTHSVEANLVELSFSGNSYLDIY